MLPLMERKDDSAKGIQEIFGQDVTNKWVGPPTRKNLIQLGNGNQKLGIKEVEDHLPHPSTNLWD